MKHKERISWRLAIRVARQLDKYPNMHPSLIRSMVQAELREVLKNFDVHQRPARGHK